MKKAQRRRELIERIARENPNADRQCMAAYMDRVLPAVQAVCVGTEFQGKERVIAMRAYEVAG